MSDILFSNTSVDTKFLPTFRPCCSGLLQGEDSDRSGTCLSYACELHQLQSLFARDLSVGVGPARLVVPSCFLRAATQHPGSSSPASLLRRSSAGVIWMWMASLSNSSLGCLAMSTTAVSSHLMVWWSFHACSEKRYVDDTCCIVKKDATEGLLDHLNSVRPSIQLTVEAERDGMLPFLDTLLRRREDGHLDVTVYRKPTHTDRYLDFQSHHPPHVKRGLVRCLYDRARAIASTQDNLQKEEHHLSEVLRSNGYPGAFIRSAAWPPQREEDPQDLPSERSSPPLGDTAVHRRRQRGHQAGVQEV